MACMSLDIVALLVYEEHAESNEENIQKVNSDGDHTHYPSTKFLIGLFYIILKSC